MAGQNDFLIFDENRENMLTQELYQSDADRTEGFKKGLARSNVSNKALHQTTMMCHAIGELAKDRGLLASDEGSVDDLKNVISNILGGANVDLSNLTAEGQAKFNEKVSKTGDTMTGRLYVDTETDTVPIMLKGMGLDMSTNRTSQTWYGIELQDKNGTRVGRLEGSVKPDGEVLTQISASRLVNGNLIHKNFSIGVDASGNPTFTFPQITQSYVNGTSGYIVFSDNLSIQWGQHVNSSGGNLTQNTITFLKRFANANYMIQRTNIGVTGDGPASIYTTIKSKTASNFVAVTTTTASATTFSWLAIGYIA